MAGGGRECFWDLMKSKMIDTYFYTGGYKIVNCQLINIITITVREFVVSPCCNACALRGPEKGNLTFQRHVLVNAKKKKKDRLC